MTLKELASKIGGHFQVEAARLNQESTILKVVLIVGGGAAATVAQFMPEAAKAPIPWDKIVGMSGAAAMALGGLYATFRERHTPAALEDARCALEAAREFQTREIDQKLLVEELEEKHRRLAHLYQAMQLMAYAIEQNLTLPSASEEKAALSLLELSSNSIRAAIDFQMDEQWTLSVYQAQTTTSGTELVCVAADRFDQRAASGTRRWQIGVGHTGAAYARGSEIVVPDLAHAALGTLDQLPRAKSHATDQERYRSIAAVPICLDPSTPPWGVVVATSDRPHRFTLNVDEKGSLGAEMTRAFAAMIGLAVSAQRARP